MDNIGVKRMSGRFNRHESEEDYLEAIMLIRQENGNCRSVQIADRLGITKPSVSVAIRKLQEDGLITINEEKWIDLTELGRETAERTYAKHHYFKTLLQAAGVKEEIAEEEACAMEHAISDDSFQKIRERHPEEKL